MVEMKQLMVSCCLLGLVLLASVPSSQAGPAQLRARREARPLLGGLVSDLTSPFINFFRPRPSKRPARPHHHQRPAASYHRPSPSYPPPPVYHHPAAPAAPPAPKPQIQVLPAPDLSHSAPQDSPAVAPPYEAPVEEPAVAPAYQPIYYGQELAPVYEPQTYEPAVVEPAAVEPAVVEPAVVEPAVVEPAVKEVVDTKVAAVIDTKSADPEDQAIEFSEEPVVEAVAPVVEDEGRQPKLLVAVEDPSQFTAPQAGSEEEIIIDLTQDLDLGLDSLGVSNQIVITPPEEPKFVEVVEEVEEPAVEEVVEEVLITGDQSDKEPQIISFTTSQIPSVFAPPQKTNEIISFVPVEPEQPDQSAVEPAVPVLEEVSQASPVSVTPLLQDQDLRSLLQQGEEQLDQLVPLDFIETEDAEDSEDGFALIDSDYTEADNLIADLEIDAIIEDITATENILENIVTTTPSTLPQTTKTDITVKELEAVPPTIASDPVFKEIISNGEEGEKEQVKRGFGNYDPRHNRVYAHKYSDKFSNWYYFRRGY